MVDIADNLFQAIEILINKRINEIAFDKSIIAIVEDDTDGYKGKYIVNNGSSSFVAFGTENAYKINDSVMVTIPEGNYDNQKIIIGKSVAEDQLMSSGYKSSLDSIIDMTGNIIMGQNDWEGFYANSNTIRPGHAWSELEDYFEKTGLYKNNCYSWDSGEIYLQGYTCLGLSAHFSTLLQNQSVQQGNFGLVLALTFKNVEIEDDTRNTFTKIVKLDSDEFFGNIYEYGIHQKESAVFDIKEFVDYPLIRVKGYVYQRNNFLDSEKSRIEVTNKKNLFVGKPYVCLGYYIKDFNEDLCVLTSKQPLNYYKDLKVTDDENFSESAALTERARDNLKDIYLQWIHKDEKTSTVNIVHQVPTNYEIRWYQYTPGVKSPDRFAGAHWTRIYPTNSFEYLNFSPDVNLQTEKFKAVILKTTGEEGSETLVIESNLLTFENLSEVTNPKVIQDMNALGIIINDGGKDGNYFLYNRAGNLNNTSDRGPWKLTAVFDLNESDNSQKSTLQLLDSKDSITWIFPKRASMISPVTDNLEESQFKEDGNYIYINGLISVNYLIAAGLNPSSMNNVVQLKVTKDGVNYNAQRQMYFGTAGTSGSDYTLRINWLDNKYALNVGKGSEDILEGQVQLLDQTGLPVDFSKATVECEWTLAINDIQNTDQTQQKTYVYLEEKRNLFYPVKFFSSESAFGKFTQEDMDFYYLDSTSNYLLSLSESEPTYYYYSLSQDLEGESTFEPCAYGLETYSTIYRRKIENDPVESNRTRKKIEFVEVKVVPLSEVITEQNVQQYAPNKFYIKHGDRYVIDPWGRFSEIETYYRPRLLDPVLQDESCLSCKYEDGKIIIEQKKDETNNYLDFNIKSLYILKITLSDFGDYPLEAYFPIPLTTGQVKYIEGPTSVRYSTDGELDYYKNPYKAISKDNQILTNGYWKLIYNRGVNNIEPDNQFVPHLIETSENGVIGTKSYYYDFKEPVLEPLGMYFSDAPEYGVYYCNNYGQVLWVQPIFVYQDNYPSTTLNKWNGKDIQTDNNTGTLVANGFAAGRKERDNTFTGVVLGDWSRTDADRTFATKQTGVYGFNHGAMSYALKDDGTAFFGKDGKGRIYLDGNQALLYSSNWKLKELGMFLDLDDGYLHMNSLNTNAYHSFSTLESFQNFYDTYHNNFNINIILNNKFIYGKQLSSLIGMDSKVLKDYINSQDVCACLPLGNLRGWAEYSVESLKDSNIKISLWEKKDSINGISESNKKCCNSINVEESVNDNLVTYTITFYIPEEVDFKNLLGIRNFYINNQNNFNYIINTSDFEEVDADNKDLKATIIDDICQRILQHGYMDENLYDNLELLNGVYFTGQNAFEFENFYEIFENLLNSNNYELIYNDSTGAWEFSNDLQNEYEDLDVLSLIKFLVLYILYEYTLQTSTTVEEIDNSYQQEYKNIITSYFIDSNNNSETKGFLIEKKLNSKFYYALIDLSNSEQSLDQYITVYSPIFYENAISDIYNIEYTITSDNYEKYFYYFKDSFNQNLLVSSRQTFATNFEYQLNSKTYNVNEDLISGITVSSKESLYPLSIGLSKQINNRKFKVTWDGIIYAEDAVLDSAHLTNANIETARITNATVEGKITAKSGKIGNWTIQNNQLKSNNGTTILNGAPASDGDPSIITEFIDLKYKTTVLQGNYPDFVCRLGKVIGRDGDKNTENFGLISTRSLIFQSAATSSNLPGYNNLGQADDTKGNIALRASHQIFLNAGNKMKLTSQWGVLSGNTDNGSECTISLTPKQTAQSGNSIPPHIDFIIRNPIDNEVYSLRINPENIDKLNKLLSKNIENI